jgi:hypothetical protein
VQQEHQENRPTEKVLSHERVPRALQALLTLSPVEANDAIQPGAVEERDYDEHEAAETQDCKGDYIWRNQAQDKRGTEH